MWEMRLRRGARGTRNGVDQGNGDAGPVEQEELIAALEASSARVLCDVIFECPSQLDAESLSAATRFKDEAECDANILGVFGLDVSGDLKHALESGRQRFEPSKAQACVDAIEGYLATRDACDGLEGFEPPECIGVFEGAVELGGGCVESGDCAGDAKCATAEDACYGTCEPSGTCGERTLRPRSSNISWASLSNATAMSSRRLMAFTSECCLPMTTTIPTVTATNPTRKTASPMRPPRLFAHKPATGRLTPTTAIHRRSHGSSNRTRSDGLGVRIGPTHRVQNLPETTSPLCSPTMGAIETSRSPAAL